MMTLVMEDEPDHISYQQETQAGVGFDTEAAYSASL